MTACTSKTWYEEGTIHAVKSMNTSRSFWKEKQVLYVILAVERLSQIVLRLEQEHWSEGEGAKLQGMMMA